MESGRFPYFLMKSLVKKREMSFFIWGYASAKDLLDVLRQATTVPNGYKRATSVVDARHGNGFAIKPVHNECLSGKIEGVFTQIGARRKLALQIRSWKIWIGRCVVTLPKAITNPFFSSFLCCLEEK